MTTKNKFNAARQCLAFIACACLASLLSGCLSQVPAVESAVWLLDATEAKPIVSKPKFGSVRLAQLAVCAPYDAKQIVVLRHDGTVAFDSFNRFAALPSALLKGMVGDVLDGTGAFQSVLPAYSGAASDCSVEVYVKRIALDGRNGSDVRASVSLTMILTGRGGSIQSISTGESEVPVESGAYGKALSRALTEALGKAVAAL